MNHRLSKSGIEYLNYGWNFYSGCLNWKNGVCPVGSNCWAKKTTERFPDHYPNGFEPTYYPEAFVSPLSLKKPSVIGCAFMGDLFGDWVDPEKKMEALMPSGKASVSMSLKGFIYTTIQQCPQHKFLFLTKCPQNYIKWSPFPANAWPGATATNQRMWNEAICALSAVEASVKYISVEPYLEQIIATSAYDSSELDWLIIGSQTKPTVYPRIEDVKVLVESADRAGIPVFLKNNLKDGVLYRTHYLNDTWAYNHEKEWLEKGLYRQEMPGR